MRSISTRSSLLAATAILLAAAASPAIPSGFTVSPQPNRRTPRPAPKDTSTPAQRRDRARWNALVQARADAKKAAKLARKAGRA